MSASAPSTDLLQIDDHLTDEERLIRDTVRAFTGDRVLPHVEDWFEEGLLPRDIMPELGKLGVLGMHLTGYGCAGAGAVAYGVACRELEACDSGLRSAASVQGSLSMYPIWRYGSEEQKNEWLPRMASGEAVGCFGLTEPDHGSDPGSMRTFAQKDGADWVLSGTKMWITNGSVADVAVVWARTEEGIRGFLVEKGTAGFSSSELHGKLSMRASVTSSLAFNNCKVSECAMLPGAKGLKGPLGCLSQARYGIGWGVIGAAMDCYETARQYAIVRKQFDDRPIASHQLVQEKLAWMITEITKAQLLALHAGRLKDQGKLEPAHVSMLKRNNTAIALECARLSRDLLGANGIIDDYPIMRHLCNLETVKTYEGTDHIHALVIGERVTGVAAYR